MAAAAMTFETLSGALMRGEYRPVYLLHGEEGYFIDELVKKFENILSDEEKEFNQYVLYAPQTAMEEVADICRRFPMLSDRQVVILKEAQSARADQLDRLARYISNPSPQTILVICSRGAAAKGKEMMSALKKSGAVIFESKKIPEWNLAGHIQNFINARGLNVQPKALEMIKDSIGTDLSRLYNEIEKLTGILGSGATVTPEAVERHIGVSKDYNVYELVDALAVKDSGRAMRIAAYFRANPKAAPTVMVSAAIFSLFSDLLAFQSTSDKSDSSLMRALNLRSPYPLKRLRAAASHYNAWQSIEVIRALRAFDAATKGIGSRRGEYDLLEELIFRILTAPGTLFPKY